MGNGKKSSVSEQIRDVNSREIFRNPTLCAQFLRDNVDIPLLKQVQPEDIEDVTERYQAYFGVEFETDTVKRIRLKNKDGKLGDDFSLFMVSLIEHKSRVDYDITMQLLRYMVCIWHEYAKEAEQKKEGASKRKGFLYPPILPVVYYEGASRWTAARRLSERIACGDVFGGFVPDFKYEVINIHNYSNQLLLDRGDEMSLLMLINKLQSPEDFQEFRQSPSEKVADVLKNADPHILKIMRDVMYSLMMKMNIPIDEAGDYVKVLGESQMGYLFENMKKIDIQAERRNAAEAKQQAEEAQMQAEEAQKQAAEARRQAEEAQKRMEEIQEREEIVRKESEYKTYIVTCRDFNCTKEETASRFFQKFSDKQADNPAEAMEWVLQKVEQYWNEA